MRVIIHNPHVESHFGTTVFNFITRRVSFKKYSYLLRLSEISDVHYAFYIDYADSSFPPLLLKWKLIMKLEYYMWMLLNCLSPFNVEFLDDPEDIKKEDIFISFMFRNFTRDNNSLDFLARIPACKLFHTTHYMISTNKMAKNALKYGVTFFMGENNLAKNSEFFKKYFKGVKNVYTLPFTYQSRFTKIIPFEKRKNKCFASGTLRILSGNDVQRYAEFIDFFHNNALHPMRKYIYKHRTELTDIIDSYIHNYTETYPKEVLINDGIFLRNWKRFYNNLFVKQKKYFEFNIVSKYNEYRMFVVPEEASGLPGIGFVEGMACGSAYIGLKDPMYSDIGLIDDVHYIGYDGTKKNLREKIEYYINNDDACRKIAQSGHDFIRNNFNQTSVLKRFVDDLQKLHSSRDHDNSPIFNSSFVRNEEY